MENEKILVQSVVDIAGEAYRFKAIYEKVLSKLELREAEKYRSQFNWFMRKINKSLDAAGLRVVDLSGKLFDSGMPVTPLNIDDFDSSDSLFVEKMIEPVLMDNGTDAIVKTGTVILSRGGKE